jgi:hypothetical protein
LAREKQIPHYARDDNLRGGLLVGVAEIEERSLVVAQRRPRLCRDDNENRSVDGAVLVGGFWIEERSFVAKGAPLDDGQIRTRDELAVIVTAKERRR